MVLFMGFGILVAMVFTLIMVCFHVNPLEPVAVRAEDDLPVRRW